MALEFKTATYLSRFACIGSACEATCCAYWKIWLTKADHAQLERSIGAEPTLWNRIIRSDTPGVDGSNFAYMQPRADGACSMLEPDGLCTIQRNHGEPALPFGCATYPRLAYLWGDQVEVTATLGCPEVARLALLSEDGTDFIPGRADQLPRQGVIPLALQSADFYENEFPAVRQLLVSITKSANIPLSTRLYFIAYLATESHTFFHRGAPPDAPQKYQRLTDDLFKPQRLKTLQRDAGRVAKGAAALEAAICEVIRSIAQSSLHTSYTHAFQAAAGEFGGVASTTDWMREYRSRRKRMLKLAHVEARFSSYLENYCLHFWTREPYVRSASLRSYVFGFALRMSVLKCVLVAQPQVREILEEFEQKRNGISSQRRSELLSTLDAAVVDVVHSLTRVFDHDVPLQRMVSGIEESLTTLDQAAALLQI